MTRPLASDDPNSELEAALQASQQEGDKGQEAKKEVLRLKLKQKLTDSSIVIEGQTPYIPQVDQVAYGLQFAHNGCIALIGFNQNQFYGCWRKLSSKEQKSLEKDVTGAALSQIKPYYSDYRQMTVASQSRLDRAVNRFFQLLQLPTEQVTSLAQDSRGEDSIIYLSDGRPEASSPQLLTKLLNRLKRFI